MKSTISVFFFFSLIFFSIAAFATHNRAGEITYRFVGQNLQDLTYEVTITTYTKTSSAAADRPVLTGVAWGDGTTQDFVRDSKFDFPPSVDISINVYTERHTYAGNGSYLINFTDPNRNASVVNIPNSVNVPFYIESLLIINPYLGPNSSPVLTYPPIDKGCVGRTFIHNPNAYDPQGDSLSYELVVCGGNNGQPIPGYTFPATSGSFGINAVTGDLIWDAPIAPGEYNVAFNINQYKRGVFAGYVRRDMQILIENCSNNPPVIQPLRDTCVLAGDTVKFDVTAIDPDGNRVVLSGSGGPFLLPRPDSATLTTVQTNNDTVISTFTWPTSCNVVRTQPYYVQFKAIDIVPANEVSLVDLKGLFIRIVSPPPQSLNASPLGSNIILNWSAPPCPNFVGYKIYRRNGQYPGTISCPCETGVPSYTGFTLLETITDRNTTTFTDDNNGQGLVIGIQYCYFVTAFFADETESCASPQACATLIKDAPVITNADVRTTDPATGSMYVAWSKPTQLDQVQFPGPYEYRLYRGNGFTQVFNQIATFGDLNDTIYIDTLIDTQTQPYTYRIELYYTNNGVLTLKGNTANASSVFLTISPTDNRNDLNWQEVVPWTNYRYDIFRLNDVTLVYDSIASTTQQTFSDTGLVNGTQYCYYIRSVGTYSFPGFIDPIINRSQQTCATPIDNVPPCAPALTVASDCDEKINQLVWTNPNNTCSDDVYKYNIYFSPVTGGSYELIDSILSATDTIYLHSNLEILSGCYKVTAVDSAGNETVTPQEVCVDTCRRYVLPSVFTPNGDGRNDLFHPCDATTSLDLQNKNCPPYLNVKSVDMKIYNRWGLLVYETDNIDVNWDGKEQKSKKDVPDGVYYYTCKVNFFSVRGENSVDLKGTIQLIR